MFSMDKVFHARIHFLMYLFLAVLVVGVCFSFLHRMGLCAALTLLLLVVAVERIIHTTYTLTADGRLVVSHGRFSRRLDIPLSGLRRGPACAGSSGFAVCGRAGTACFLTCWWSMAMGNASP